MGFADASFNPGGASRFVSGYVFMNNTAAVSWKSNQQPTIALLSAEAEYVSLSVAVVSLPTTLTVEVCMTCSPGGSSPRDRNEVFVSANVCGWILTKVLPKLQLLKLKMLIVDPRRFLSVRVSAVCRCAHRMIRCFLIA